MLKNIHKLTNTESKCYFKCIIKKYVEEEVKIFMTSYKRRKNFAVNET